MASAPSFRKTPQHEHDCDHCIYLGSVFKDFAKNTDDDDLYADLYIHKAKRNIGSTVIARYGPDGDYVSNLYSSTINGDLALATIHALLKGHLTIDELKEHVRMDSL